MKRLKERVAVITGAGSGIGRATALALADKGCHLALSDINTDTLKESAAMARDRGVRVSEHRVNVGVREEIENFARDVESEHQAVHILVNNAGIGIQVSFIHQTVEQIERIVNINLLGVVYGCKYFLPLMIKQDEGHIVNISSAAGLNPLPGSSTYALTKFAVRGFSESIRHELNQNNVGVSSVHPGMINTNILHGTEYENAETKIKNKETFEKYGHSPEKVANKIVTAIEKNQQRVLIGPEVFFWDTLKRAFPVRSDRWLCKVLNDHA